MFFGALNPTKQVRDRLRDWAETLWPGSGRIDLGEDVMLYHSADAGILPIHQLATEGGWAAVDGYLWHGAAIPAEADAARRMLRALGETLAADGGWPLEEAWDGSFTAAVHDRDAGILALAVDPVGLRRLYYGRQGRTVVFGATQGVCAYALGLEPDWAGVAQWLVSGIVLGRRTLFAGLREVLPGERVRLDAEGKTIDSRIDVPWHRGVRARSPDEAAAALAPLLEAEARRYGELGERVGLALSAGLDSRLVLAALGEDAAGRRSYTYGDPGEVEVRLAARCARAAGTVHRTVNLVGRLFPPEETLRRAALRTEAVAYPFWPATGDAARRDGVDALLLGDVTNSLQTRIAPLWDRGERIKLRLRGLVGGREIPEDRGAPAIEEWLEGYGAFRALAAGRLAERLGLDVDRREIERAVAADLDEMAPYVNGTGGTTADWVATGGVATGKAVTGGAATGEAARGAPSLFQAQERFYLATERQLGGTQAVALAGELDLVPVFASRRIVAAALDVAIETRAGRRLLHALADRMLRGALRRVPTATVPLVGPTAPRVLQEAVWLGRWSADAAIRMVKRRFPNVFPRGRLLASWPLRPEYARAAEDFYGRPWAVSGALRSEYYVGRVRRTAAWRKPPVLPENELRAVAADTILAAAREGPELLRRLDDLPRT